MQYLFQQKEKKKKLNVILEGGEQVLPKRMKQRTATFWFVGLKEGRKKMWTWSKEMVFTEKGRTSGNIIWIIGPNKVFPG